VKSFIIPDIVLFVNGIPLVVVECKKGSETCANPMQEAFVQLQRYMRRRKETEASGLKEGEPRLFHSNLLLVRSCGLEADYGTITSGEEHFYAWKTLFPPDDAALAGLNAQQQLIAGMLNRATCCRSCAPARCSWTPTAARASRWCAATSSSARPGKIMNACAGRNGHRAQRRGVAHPGLGQVADHGVSGANAARQPRPERLQDRAGQ
jgi:hypothetical protein